MVLRNLISTKTGEE